MSYVNLLALAVPAIVLVGCSDGESESVEASVVINEFVASNTDGLKDEDGDLSDWIELRNLGSSQVSLKGWHLTDDAGDLAKWTFPDVTIAPKGFLVVFASSKDRRTAGATSLHTNFKLKSSGEYLALIEPGQPPKTKTEFAPTYPEQAPGISYGRYGGESFHHLSPPTPGSDNTQSHMVEAPAPLEPAISFSEPSGVFFDSLELRVSGEGVMRYTLDGSIPTMSSARVTGPISLSASTQVRVGVEGSGGLESITTGVFICLDGALRNRTSNLPIAVVDAFEDHRIDDEGRPRTFRAVASAFFDVDAASQQASLAGTPVFAGRGGLHIRGNSTAGYEKKQYSFETWGELDEDIDVPLLGFPSDSDWVLHAPYADKTLMRNHLMYLWSNRMGRYASRTKFIELYLNKEGETVTSDDYAGVYILMEKVKRGASRVNVESLSNSQVSSDEISGGYILEKGWNFSEEVGIETQRLGDQLLFSYPKAEAVTQEQRQYLQSFFDGFEQALLGDDFADPALGYGRYIDVESFIDHHLMVELGRNIDGFVLSTYMHKSRGGKLKMGPIWDYNGALGNPDYFEGWLTDGWHHQNPEFPADNPNAYRWYERLMEDPGFRSRYRARWRELRETVLTLPALMNDIDETVLLLGSAVDRNFERWQILGNYVWPNAEGFEERDTYQKEIDYMKEWIRDRFIWMDAQLAEP